MNHRDEFCCQADAAMSRCEMSEDRDKEKDLAAPTAPRASALGWWIVATVGYLLGRALGWWP